jgi:hypothetical protein
VPVCGPSWHVGSHPLVRICDMKKIALPLREIVACFAQGVQLTLPVEA